MRTLADAVIGVPTSAFNFPISGFQLFPTAALPPDAPAAKRQQPDPGYCARCGGFGNGSDLTTNGKIINARCAAYSNITTINGTPSCCAGID